MKNKQLFYLILGMFACLSTANAQINKGSLMIGGGFGFNTGSNKTTSSNGSTSVSSTSKGSEFSFTPRVGYFLINNLALGLGLDIGNSSTTYTEDGKTYKSGSGSTSIAPFVRYYYPVGKVYPFVEANIGFGSQSTKSTDADGKETTNKTSLSSFGVGPGVAFFLNDNVALDASIMYGSINSKWTGSGTNPTTYKSNRGRIMLGLGIQAFLRK